MSSTLSEQIAPNCGILPDSVCAELDALCTGVDASLFAWAVRSLVNIGDGAYADDAVALAKAMASCGGERALLCKWIKECRRRMGLHELSDEQTCSLLDAQVIDIATPEGFKAVATQFAQHSPTLTMEAATRSGWRPSTPPPTAMGGAANVYQ